MLFEYFLSFSIAKEIIYLHSFFSEWLHELKTGNFNFWWDIVLLFSFLLKNINCFIYFSASPVPSPVHQNKPSPSHPSQPCATGLYDFEPENPGELGFKVSELIDRMQLSLFLPINHGENFVQMSFHPFLWRIYFEKSS